MRIGAPIDARWTHLHNELFLAVQLCFMKIVSLHTNCSSLSWYSLKSKTSKIPLNLNYYYNASWNGVEHRIQKWFRVETSIPRSLTNVQYIYLFLHICFSHKWMEPWDHNTGVYSIRDFRGWRYSCGEIAFVNIVSCRLHKYVVHRTNYYYDRELWKLSRR